MVALLLRVLQLVLRLVALRQGVCQLALERACPLARPVQLVV